MVSFIKGIIRTLLIIFLVFLLSNFILSFSISQSIKPEIVEPVFKDLIASSVLRGVDLSKYYMEFSLLCNGKESIEVPLGQDSEETLPIDCDKLRDSNPPQLKELVIESMFNKIYYKDYNCIFLDCFENLLNSAFILSSSAPKFFINLAYTILAVFLVLLLVLMLLINLKGIASIFLVNGIASFLFFTRKSIISQMTQMPQFGHFIPLISNFLYYISILSLFCLVIGLILLIIPKLLPKKEVKQKKRRHKK